jgi:hypothetical protein
VEVCGELTILFVFSETTNDPCNSMDKQKRDQEKYCYKQKYYDPVPGSTKLSSDGYRCLAGRDSTGVTLWSSRRNLFTTQSPHNAHARENICSWYCLAIRVVVTRISWNTIVTAVSKPLFPPLPPPVPPASAATVNCWHSEPKPPEIESASGPVTESYSLHY